MFLVFFFIRLIFVLCWRGVCISVVFVLLLLFVVVYWRGVVGWVLKYWNLKFLLGLIFVLSSLVVRVVEVLLWVWIRYRNWRGFFKYDCCFVLVFSDNSYFIMFMVLWNLFWCDSRIIWSGERLSDKCLLRVKLILICLLWSNIFIVFCVLVDIISFIVVFKICVLWFWVFYLKVFGWFDIDLFCLYKWLVVLLNFVIKFVFMIV